MSPTGVKLGLIEADSTHTKCNKLIAELEQQIDQLIDDKSNLLREVNRMGAEIADERKLRAELVLKLQTADFNDVAQIIARIPFQKSEVQP